MTFQKDKIMDILNIMLIPLLLLGLIFVVVGNYDD